MVTHPTQHYQFLVFSPFKVLFHLSQYCSWSGSKPLQEVFAFTAYCFRSPVECRVLLGNTGHDLLQRHHRPEYTLLRSTFSCMKFNLLCSMTFNLRVWAVLQSQVLTLKLPLNYLGLISAVLPLILRVQKNTDSPCGLRKSVST